MCTASLAGDQVQSTYVLQIKASCCVYTCFIFMQDQDSEQPREGGGDVKVEDADQS